MAICEKEINWGEKKNDLCDSHHKGKTVNLSIQMLQQVPPEEGNLLYFLIPQQSLCLLKSGQKHFFPSPPCGSSDIVLQSLSTGSMGVYIPSEIVSVYKKCVLKTSLRISRGLEQQLLIPSL